MPTYEYLCEKCGHQFDLFQSIKESALAVCPKDRCAQKKWGKGRVKKLISAGGGLLFKGSGFYTTDYRSDKYHAAAKKDSAPTSSPATTSASGDAKPAASSAAPAKAEKKSAAPGKAKD